MRENIGEFIKEQRIKNKTSQNKLAEILYIDRTLISKWENGKATPCMNEIVKMAELFHISIEEFISGEIYTKTNKEDIKENFNQFLINQDNKLIKFKKYLISSTILILSIITCFLSYYFYNTFNRTIVYKVTGESQNYNLNTGLLLITRESSYFKIGHFDKNINKIPIYYNDNLIYEGDPDMCSIDNIGYNSSINTKNINNLYMIIYNNKNEVEKMELTLTKKFTNNKLTYNSKPEVLKENSIIEQINLDDFKCENNVCRYEDDKNKIVYDKNLKNITIKENNIWIEYYINEKDFTYKLDNKLQLHFLNSKKIYSKSINNGEELYNYYIKHINKIISRGE